MNNKSTFNVPALLQEWDYEKNGDLRPDDFIMGSNKKVWWKCKLGHSWQERICSRALGRCNCPYCSNRRVWQGYNDLVTTHPEVAIQWDYDKNNGFRPEQFSIGSNKKFWWKCELGHSWQAVMHSRKFCGCAVCAGKAVMKGSNDLQTLNPRVAKEWDFDKNGDLRPDNVTICSNKKVWWICKRGHNWKAMITSRASDGQNCPYCSNKKVWQGYNDLVTTHPDVAAQWDYEKNGDLRPEQFTIGAHKKIWWKCECGYSWQAMMYTRKSCGCAVCAGKAVMRGVNDLQTLNPNVAKEWDYGKNGNLHPENFTSGSNKKVWWKCKLGHSWKTIIAHRFLKGSNCPYCAGRKVWGGYNDIVTTHPDIAGEWDFEKNGDLRPEQFSIGSNKRVWWKCKYGHSWQTMISKRKSTGCPVCAGKVLAKGINDLQTVNPDLAKEWDSIKNGNRYPESVTAYNNSKAWWLCAKGHSWEAVISDRSFGNGCPYCIGKVPMRSRLVK